MRFRSEVSMALSFAFGCLHTRGSAAVAPTLLIFFLPDLNRRGGVCWTNAWPAIAQVLKTAKQHLQIKSDRSHLDSGLQRFRAVPNKSLSRNQFLSLLFKAQTPVQAAPLFCL